MVTDSLSFLSYTRHEYFRRVLCDVVDDWVENGKYTVDFDLLGKIIQDICFHNVQNYLSIEL
ncbi:glucuronate isomerase [Sporosarcina sp. FSL K6-2383]|uniref:glucuronate isomerase n=1 Tax=Sporosarcina sp. FSL K6-2383 TaxID=2921556 RepID=UPI00315B1C53